MKTIQPFINPSSCYIAIKKSQQIFHSTFTINFIAKNLILVGTNKLLSVSTCILLLSRLEPNIFYRQKRLVGKIHTITTQRVQLAAYFESCKSSQLHYQDKHLRTAKIYFCNLLKVSEFFVFHTRYREFPCLYCRTN